MIPETVDVRVSTGHPDFPFERQTEGSTARWGRYTFHFDYGLEKADAWIVCDRLLGPESCECPDANVMLITWEPPAGVTYDPKFLRQFTHVLTCHPKLRHRNKHLGLQGHPWHVERDFDTLMASHPVTKDRSICVISSDKQMWEGHRLRLEFVTRLKAELGDRIDVLGRGIKTFDSKWDALTPYRYSVAIENDRTNDWVTEKLFDCYLTDTFPIYFGAPNVHEFVPAGAIEVIDIRQPDEAIDAVRRVLADVDHYERNLPNILDAKKRYLTELQFFPLMSKLLDSVWAPGKPKTKRLMPAKIPTVPHTTRLKSWLVSARNRIGIQ